MAKKKKPLVDPDLFKQTGHCREINPAPTHIFGYIDARPEEGIDEGHYMVKNVENGMQEFMSEEDFLKKFWKTDENGKDWHKSNQSYKDRPIRSLGSVLVEQSDLPQALKDVFS